MVESQPQVLQHVDTAEKLRSSICQHVMIIDPTYADHTTYRCAEPCGKHTAAADQIRAGLLWHYRGRCVDTTFGLSDEAIEDDMFAALHTAWIRNGNIYTARFQ